MQNKSITFKAKMWMWPGDMPWHFVNVDKEISEEIRKDYPISAMVKVEVKILSSESVNEKTKISSNLINFEKENIIWKTAFFRSSRDKIYIMPIKKDIRKKADILAGETIRFEVKIT
jgi:hypothetical protein